jgi:hypothetical protein
VQWHFTNFTAICWLIVVPNCQTSQCGYVAVTTSWLVVLLFLLLLGLSFTIVAIACPAFFLLFNYF